jgi:uncharacterized integral membrane protein
MKRALQWLILLPIAIVGIAFAVANRQSVDVSFNPFESPATSSLALEAPLFLVMFLAVAFGVLLGGIFTWFTQGRHRRALRETRSEVARLKSQGNPKAE